MIWRWVPLAMLAVWSLLLHGRVRWQKRRHGSDPVFLGKSADRAQRWRDDAGRVLFVALDVEALLVGLGHVSLASADVARWSGVALGFGGSLCMLSAQLEMGASWRIGIDPNARTPLVTHGWYRFSRNPIFVFMVLSFVGLALLVSNLFTWSVVALIVLGVRRQVAAEERWLRDAYGEEWRTYAARVGRFVPGVGRIERA